MGLKTAQEYKESLRDGRVVYYKGEKVEDVTRHPELSVCVDTMALDYELGDLAPSGALDYCYPPEGNRFFAVWTNPTNL